MRSSFTTSRIIRCVSTWSMQPFLGSAPLSRDSSCAAAMASLGSGFAVSPVPQFARWCVGLDPIHWEGNGVPRHDRRLIATVVLEGLQENTRHNIVQVVDDRPRLS